MFYVKLSRKRPDFEKPKPVPRCRDSNTIFTPGDDRFAQYDHEKPNIYDYRALINVQKLRKKKSKIEEGMANGEVPWQITPFQRGESDSAREMILEITREPYYSRPGMITNLSP